MIRHIVADTETTGMNAQEDRIIQIAAVELVDLKITGRTFCTYVNPEGRDIKFGSYQVHKISKDMLIDAPTYRQIHASLVDFIGDGQLVIHNKNFDLGFLRAEACRAGFEFPHDATDSIDVARQKWPGAQVGLDALSKRLNIPRDKNSLEDLARKVKLDRSVTFEDRSERHDALVDCLILAQVYIAMMSDTELDLTQNQAVKQLPWPFKNHKISLPSLNI